MRSIFEDPGNRKALKMDKKVKSYKIHIREPAELNIKLEDMFFNVRSALIQNKIQFTEETIIN